MTLKKIKKVADPYRPFYPENSKSDCEARSIRDMRFFDGAIYIGCGDYRLNAGPILVLSFTNSKNTIKLYPEFVVDEEAIEVFRVYNNTLYVPGKDARQDWSFGNYYFKRSNIWYKRRTIPKAKSVHDIAVFDNELFTLINSSSGIGMARKSSDDGKTWKLITQSPSTRKFGTSLLPLNGKLLIVGMCHYYVYENSNAKKYRLKEPFVESRRIEYFTDGAISIPVLLFRLVQVDGFFAKKVPLFFMDDVINGPVRVPEFDEEGVFTRDIVIRNNICYVMAVNGVSRKGYKTVIKSSNNLHSWTEVAKFTVPALPYSFELLKGEFYVGLGNKTNAADRESGTIWRID